MSRTRLVHSYYDGKTSTVIKSSPYGMICRSATVNELEDNDIANQWDGCMIAEMRVNIEMQKRRTKQLNHRVTVINEVINNVNKELSLHPEKYRSKEDILGLLDSLQRSAKKQSQDNKDKLRHMKDTLPGAIDSITTTRRYMRTRAKEKQKNKK